jgi:hypothetical protein
MKELTSEEKFKDLMECTCKSKYVIEPHGKGHAIYWGRCQHKHGSNIAMLTECHCEDLIKYFEDSLNKNYKGKQLND